MTAVVFNANVAPDGRDADAIKARESDCRCRTNFIVGSLIGMKNLTLLTEK